MPTMENHQVWSWKSSECPISILMVKKCKITSKITPSLATNKNWSKVFTKIITFWKLREIQVKDFSLAQSKSKISQLMRSKSIIKGTQAFSQIRDHRQISKNKKWSILSKNNNRGFKTQNLSAQNQGPFMNTILFINTKFQF
jgi:hypothetical protein